MPSLAGSPAFTAWHAAGAPEPAVAASDTARGGVWCAACGTDELAMLAATQVVSRKFTDLESWVYGGDWLCAACAWTYATAELRRTVYVVDQQPPARTVFERPALGRLLAAGPLPADRMVVVPVRGRRHILPTARWGHVCTDDTQVRWDDAAVDLLLALRWLRTLPGIRAVMLTDPAPPIAVLRATPSEQWSMILERWDVLQAWRTHPGAWWDAAIALSTPETVGAPQ
ncbi:hypothetical protein [Gordonia sp. CNJ-863]|uniref:hypothetical protein n=1 Tax=Gordonia sp. CNJ-863 TaxID=1904963 RepID=UPI0021CAF4B7|nr:hypothetical protein [Gordonia sp. CNJ-863]